MLHPFKSLLWRQTGCERTTSKDAKANHGEPVRPREGERTMETKVEVRGLRDF